MTEQNEDAPSTSRANDVIEIRRNPRLLGLALLAVAMVPVPWGLAWSLGSSGLAATSLVLTGTAVALLAFVAGQSPAPQRVPVELKVDAGGVDVIDRDGRRRRRILRERIARGTTAPTTRGVTSLRLAGRRFGRGAHFEFSEAREAAHALGALGLDAQQSIATFEAASRIFASPRWLLGTMLIGLIGMFATVRALDANATLGPTAPLFGVACIIALLLPPLFWPTTIDVGADGVLFRWLGRERYVAHANIEDVQVIWHGKYKRVVLRLRGGEEVAFPMSGPSSDADDATLLAARLRDAIEARQRVGNATAALVRGHHGHAAWIAALRKPDAASLRTQAPLKDDYWRVLEDVSSEPLTRAAAAIALGKDLSDAERARLARAQQSIAAPKLRVVLDQVPDAGDEALAELLEQLELENERG
jgi:hypothetical protein